MKRSFAISDWFYRLSHTVRRNRFAVLLYAFMCLIFLIVGIAVGVNVSEKAEFVLRNNAAIFRFLRGDSGIVAFFFLDAALTAVYCLFAASMFFYKALAYISLAPCLYKSYVLGMNTSVIIVVYSVSSLPMLFVLFVPICIIEIFILCMISARCFKFASLNRGCMPSKADVWEYYRGVGQFIFIVIICTLVKAITLVLFGSALIGVI